MFYMYSVCVIIYANKDYYYYYYKNVHNSHVRSMYHSGILKCNNTDQIHLLKNVLNFIHKTS